MLVEPVILIQSFQDCQVVLIQVQSTELLSVPRTWLKERRILTKNIFLVHVQTILEVNKIFVQFHCLSPYQKTTGFRRAYSI